MDTANFRIIGKKTGASAEAQMEVKAAEVKCATVSVQGPDSSVSASANLKFGGPSAQVANVDFTPQGGADFHAVADLTPGIDAGNVKVGTHKGIGIGFSTRFQVGNICLSAGPPQLTIGPNFNLGFGSGGRSRVQKGKEGSGGSSGDGFSGSRRVSGGGGGRHSSRGGDGEGIGGDSGSRQVSGGGGGRHISSRCGDGEGIGGDSGSRRVSGSGGGGEGIGGVSGSGRVSVGGGGRRISSRGGDVEGGGRVSSSGRVSGGGGVRHSISRGGDGEGGRDGVGRKVSGQHNGEGIKESCESVNALSRKKRVASSSNDSRRGTGGKSTSNGGYVAYPNTGFRVHPWRGGTNSDSGYSTHIGSNDECSDHVTSTSSHMSHHGIHGHRSSSSSSELRKRGINHKSGELRNNNGFESKTVRSQNSVCGDTGNIANLHGNVLPPRNRHMMHTGSHGFPSNHGLNAQSIPRESADVISQSTHLRTSSGFGSTQRRSPSASYWSETAADHDIPQNILADKHSTQSGHHDTHSSDARQLSQISSMVKQKQMLQNDRQASEQRETSFGEQLGNLLSKKVQHIKPVDLQKDKKSVKKKEIPSSREEAKRALAKHYHKLHEDVEEKAQTSTSKPGVVDSTSRKKGKAVSGQGNTTHDEPKSASSTHDDDE